MTISGAELARGSTLIHGAERLHRCGVIAAEVRAAQYEDHEIEAAAAHLHGMLDALM